MGKGAVQGTPRNSEAFDPLLNEPFTTFFIKTRVMVNVGVVIIPFVMPSGVDDDPVTPLNFGFGLLEIIGTDDFPFLLMTHIDNNPGTETAGQRDFINTFACTDDMKRGVHVGGGVHLAVKY